MDGCSLIARRRNQPCQYQDPGLLPPELWENPELWKPLSCSRTLTQTVAWLAPICCEGSANQGELATAPQTHAAAVIGVSRKVPHWCCLYFPLAHSCPRSKRFQRFDNIDSPGRHRSTKQSASSRFFCLSLGEEPTPGGVQPLATLAAVGATLRGNRPVSAGLVPTQLPVIFLS